MQRNSALLLIACGAGAFFLPLIVRSMMHGSSLAQFSNALNPSAHSTSPAQTPQLKPQPKPAQMPQPRLLPRTVANNSTPIPSATIATGPGPDASGFGRVPPQQPKQAAMNATQPSPEWPQQRAASASETMPQPVRQVSFGAEPHPAGYPDPFDDIQGLLFKFAIATSVVLVACVASLQIAAAYGKSRGGQSNELEVCDSLAISRESGVKLIRIGSERIVVGHDRQGLRSMVLLPARFDQILAKEQEQGDPNGAIELAGDLRMAFANPEDRGWDLNRPKS